MSNELNASNVNFDVTSFIGSADYVKYYQFAFVKTWGPFTSAIY